MAQIYNKQTVSNIIMADNFTNTVCNLAFRWADESQYEDINDYGNVIKGLLEKAGLVYDRFTMTKRPFGFKIVLDYTYTSGDTVKSTLQVKVTTAGQYSWTVQSM